MDPENKILVGKIVGAQGLRGELRVQTFTENPMDFATMKIVVGANNIRPECKTQKSNIPMEIPKGECHSPLHFIRQLNQTSSVIIARIDGVNDRTAAESLVGTPLFIDRTDLPKLPAGEYYQTDLIGMVVKRAERNNSPLGGSRRSPGAHRRDGQAGGGTSSVGDTVCPPTGARNSAPTPPKGGVVAVTAVHNFGAGDILELSNGEMVSFAGAHVDLEKRIIQI